MIRPTLRRMFAILAVCAATMLASRLQAQAVGAAAGELEPDEQLLREAKIGVDPDSLIAFLKKNSASDADLQSLDALVSQLGSNRFAEREQAASKLITIGAPALRTLAGAIASRDPEISRRAGSCLQTISKDLNSGLPLAAVRVLSHHSSPKIVETLLKYLPSATDDALIEEIVYTLDALALSEGKVVPALVQSLGDPLPPRRGAAACIVGPRGDGIERAAVRRLLSDRDPLVRLRAAQGLLAAKDTSGVPVLVELLAQPAVELS